MYTAGYPLQTEMDGQDPSIFDIASAIPYSTGLNEEMEIDPETGMPIYRTTVYDSGGSNTALWIVLGILAILALSGNKKAESE
jgi:hypothetical protein